VVSRTIVSERPSTPTWYVEPIASYHGKTSWNWKPASSGSKRFQRMIVRMSGMRLAISAVHRIRPFSYDGSKAISKAAIAGKKRMMERMLFSTTGIEFSRNLDCYHGSVLAVCA
jgi:hypothetical protein